jgi:GxxExxY protein
MIENQIGKIVVDTAIAVHKQYGPGLLKAVYEVVLMHDLLDRGLQVERQVQIPLKHRSIEFEEGFRADLIIAEHVILELKAVEEVNEIHKRQLLTYLKLTDMKLGFLLDFGHVLMKNGITRMVNGL